MTSAAAVEAEFLQHARALGQLVAAGYVEHQDEICRGLKEMARNDLALRYYLIAASANPNMRRLSGAQSFAVYADDVVMMRFNLWIPRAHRPNGVDTMYDKYFSIDVPHNHSYDFFTVGVIGPGYVSDFFETSADLTDVVAGDTIDFEREWTDQLELGRTFFVPQQSVFHLQRYPESFSVSLNLIPHQPVVRGGKQLILASDRRTVETVLYATPQGPVAAENEAA